MNDEQLWDAFQQRTLPAAQWTHRAHLRVAWMHLRRHPLDDAHVLMRVGIIRLNASHALVETPVRGYHETITRGWLVLLDELMRSSIGSRAIAESQTFLEVHAESVAADALLRRYSKERLMSVEARARFVEPDQGR